MRTNAHLLVAAIAAAAWLVLAGSAGADHERIGPHDDIVQEATSAAGAVVTFTVTATNDDGDAFPVECTPQSGQVFPLGTTPVTCTAGPRGRPDLLTASFKVTVADTTAPVLRTSDVTVEATDSSGANVLYALPATEDAVDASPVVVCSPPPGPFPLGPTEVTCTATDFAGNTGEAKFVVLVADTAGPTFSGGPGAVVTREANGPGGAVVTYPLPVATDATAREPLPVTCAPAPGARFPLGETVVRCRATDGSGNPSEHTFIVVVRDTTPPTLTVPAPLSVTGPSAAGAPATDAAIAAFLAGARASDLVTAAPLVRHDAPAVLPVGTTRVTFTATDEAGNVRTGSSTVTVFAPPIGSNPPAAPPSSAPVAVPDRTPPGAVRSLRVVAGDRRIRLTWTLPPDPDLDRVTVVRSGAAAAAREPVTVYAGRGTAFDDRGVRNGMEYRYVLVGYDRAGNASPAVAAVAVPKAQLLFAPKEGARVRRPPMLVWRATPGARYYNVQLFRGRTKVFSGWPTRSRLLMRETWRFGGKRQRLLPGTYRWYVWPGFGARREARYGPVLGQSTFVRTRAGR